MSVSIKKHQLKKQQQPPGVSLGSGDGVQSRGDALFYFYLPTLPGWVRDLWAWQIHHHIYYLKA